MKKENEKISVVMSIYNGEDTLEAAIDSILNQSYKNLEILLMDDFSTDDSFKILKEYEKLVKEEDWLDVLEDMGYRQEENEIFFQLKREGDYKFDITKDFDKYIKENAK